MLFKSSAIADTMLYKYGQPRCQGPLFPVPRGRRGPWERGCKYGKQMRDFLGAFLFYFSFLYLGGVFNKTLNLLALLLGYLSSHMQ